MSAMRLWRGLGLAGLDRPWPPGASAARAGGRRERLIEGPLDHLCSLLVTIVSKVQVVRKRESGKQVRRHVEERHPQLGAPLREQVGVIAPAVLDGRLIDAENWGIEVVYR